MRHCNHIRPVVFLAALVCAFGPSTASASPTTTVSGYFSDPTNTALISSNGYGDLGSPQFGTAGNDDVVARNVAIYQLVVQQDATVVHFISTGYANGAGTPDGGALTYFSIFAGSDATSSFVDSSYYDGRNDFQIVETLAAGTYLFTIGVFDNESFAENDYPIVGTLSEGFTALGYPGALGNGFYQVAVSSDADFVVGPSALSGSPVPGAVPEPNVAALLGIGVAVLRLRRRVGIGARGRRAKP